MLKRKTTAAILFGLPISLLVAMAGCSPAGGDGSNAAASDLPESIEVVQYVGSANAHFTFDDFMQNSDAVCYATYKGSSEPMLIDPVDGADPMYFTDMHFEVEKLYAGEIPGSKGQDGAASIAVRQRGGAGELFAVVNRNAFVPEKDKSYLLFLFRIENGADYNTAGDHLYLIGDGEMGVWVPMGPSEQEPEGFKSWEGDTISVEELENYRFSGGPAKAPSANTKETFLEEVERRYQAGEVPREYYDSVVETARKEDESFARVMSEEERVAYEQRIAAMADEDLSAESE